MQFCAADHARPLDAPDIRDRGQPSGGQKDHVGMKIPDRGDIRLRAGAQGHSQFAQLMREIPDDGGQVFRVRSLDHGRQREEASRLARLLQQDHLVPAQGRNPGRLHAGRAAPDNHDFFAFFRLANGRMGGSGQPVDPAAALPPETEGAAGTGRDLFRPAVGQLVGEFGVGVQPPVHGDEVRQPLLQGFLAQVGAHPPDDRDRNVYGALDPRRQPDVGPGPFAAGIIFLREIAQGDRGLRIKKEIGQESRNVTPDPVAAHLDRVCAGGLGQAGGGAAVLVGKAFGRGGADGQSDFDAVQDDGHGKIAPGAVLHRPDRIRQQPGPVPDAATVVVLALVPEGGEEVVEQVAAGGVDVHPVEPRLARAQGGGGELFHDPFDFGDREGARLFVVVIRGVGQPRRGGGDGRAGVEGVLFVPPVHLPRAVVVYGEKGRAIVPVDDVGQFGEPGDEPVLVDPVAVAVARAPGVIYGDRFHDHEPHPPAGEALVMGLDLLPHVNVVFMPHEHAGSRLDDPVPGPDPTDRARFEDPGVGFSPRHVFPLSASAAGIIGEIRDRRPRNSRVRRGGTGAADGSGDPSAHYREIGAKR